MHNMTRIATVSELNALRQAPTAKGSETWGLVPTMGALHQGHRSLVKRALNENDHVVVSIFVNPTQFNNPNDYKTYPRTLDADLAFLAELGQPLYIFTPNAEDVYSQPDRYDFALHPLDQYMEGAHRPGHFHGVCRIVSRLIDFVKPTRAYFGEKDYQQLLIVRKMAEQMHSPVEIVGCPIVREATGLAVSSRNALLTPEHREAAPQIYKSLRESAEYIKHHSVPETEAFITKHINAAAPLLQCEYVEIADRNTLAPETEYQPERSMAFVAVQAGQVRLIDNFKY